MMRMRALTILVALGGLACGGDGDGAAGDASARERRGGGGPSVADTISDAQIAALVALINGTEAAAAKAVQPKLALPDSRAYAQMLIDDHTRLMRAMPSFAGPSVPAPQSTTLNAVFHSQAAMMGTLPAGYPFDATFAALQVTDHVMAVDSLRRWHGLTRNAELRRALAAAIPVMETHLERARTLYQRLDQRVDLGEPGPTDTVPPTSPPGPATVPADPAIR